MKMTKVNSGRSILFGALQPYYQERDRLRLVIQYHKRHGFHECSVVIGDLDLVGVIVIPDENDPPLLVDPDAMKLAQVAAQPFKAVAEWEGG